MKAFSCVLPVFGVVAAATASVASADDTTTPHMALKAVKINGMALPQGPDSEINIQPGDLVEAEVYISNWAKLPGGASYYQFRLNGREGATSGWRGTVLPVGWSAKLDPLDCSADPGVCDPDEVCSSGKCVYPDHNPIMGAFINATRPDFMFYGHSVIPDTRQLSLDYYYVAMTDEDPVPDLGEPAYAGTLKLVASEYACGTFTYGFNESGCTYIGDAYHLEHYPTLERLIIHVYDCRDPPPDQPFNCTIDAGMPHDLYDAGTRYGVDSFRIEFNVPAAGMTCLDFTVTTVPPFHGDPSTSCESVETWGYSAVIHLDRMISVEEWTCILHRETDTRVCLGYLPGDADGSLMTDPDDLLALVEELRKTPNPPMWLHECDVDRSGVCTPFDILSTIDILNGAEAFDSWEGASIPVDCPTR